MSLTKLSLAGNSLIIPARESLVSDFPVGNGKIVNLFLQCICLYRIPCNQFLQYKEKDKEYKMFMYIWIRKR